MNKFSELFAEASMKLDILDIREIEDCNRRAKTQAGNAKRLEFDWLSKFTNGAQMWLEAQIHVVRAEKAIMIFRHRRAKEEYQTAINGGRKALDLMDRALDNFPKLPGLSELVSNFKFQQVTHVYHQQHISWSVFQKNCDIDELLLIGQVREYLAGIRALASEFIRLSNAMLASGSDDIELRKICKKLEERADILKERAEAIEDIELSRDIYLPADGNKIFIIHGHSEGKWRELRDILEDDLGLRDSIVVLQEEPNQSKTIIEKFEEHAKQCCYGFALLTPDDEVTKQNMTYRQARPNVIFEIGWFYGRFGPRRLCILKQTGTEIPSDLGGVVTLQFNKDIKENSHEIEQELVTAGVLIKQV